MRRSWRIAEQGRAIAALVALLAGAAPAGGGGEDLPLSVCLAWQIALERACFSPGLIDGRIGPRTELATREFQRVRGLPVTGRLDEKTAALLGADPAKALASHTVTHSDFAQVGSVPKGWVEKSRLPYLGYPCLEEMLAEKYHCSRALLAALNAGRDLGRLTAGNRLTVPAVDPHPGAPPGDRLIVDLAARVIRAYDADRLVGLFHCSIAADRAKLPTRPATVTVIAESPTYTFDPAMWPEVKGIKDKLLIPPGPRNPVGLCWIGLSLPGYGIHGTPAPEMIGKTGSHGCFRLTNWDARRLAKMVRVGTPVSFLR